MEITTKILKERFIEYNKRYFDDKLPMVDFRRHRTGNPCARLNTPNKKEWIFDHGIPFHLCCLKFLLKYRIDALGWFTKYPRF